MTTEAEREEGRRFRRRTLTVALVLLGVAAVIWLLFRISSLLFMLFVALFVAVTLEPPVHTLEKRGWRRGAAAGLVFFLAFILATVFVVALIPLIIDQASQLGDRLPGYVDNLLNLLHDWLGVGFSTAGVGQQVGSLSDWLGSNWSSLAGGIIGLGSTILGFFIFATTVAIFSFYMVAELPKLQRTVLSFMTPKQQRDALHVWDVAVEKMGGYIYSRLILAFIGGFIASLFLTIMGVPFSVPLGIWVGVLSQFIPVVGTYLAAVLPAIVALSAQGTVTTVWVIVFFIAYQQVENYLISPRITRRTMAIHPAVSIAAILIGGALLGGIGIILALPMAAIVQEVIAGSIRRHRVILDDAGAVAEE